MREFDRLFHWRIEEIAGGEVWASGIRINGKVFKTQVFEANLNLMRFDTLQGEMHFVQPDKTFKRNVERLYGSLNAYMHTFRNLPCQGMAY